MVEKKLVIFYYYTPANKEIVEADVKEFYTDLRNMTAFEKHEVIIEHFFCPSAAALNDKLKSLTDERYGELYLHFSGHGMTNGIPFNDWVVGNENFATMLDHPKIVSCFFSSCQSADLASIASGKKIPVIIGTSSNNNIENAYAIRFQKSYYQYLSKKSSFLQAFDKATNDIEQEVETPVNKGTLVRGMIGGNIFENEPPKQLQIVFHSEKEKDRHLIYPSIVDAIDFVDDNSKILFVYADNDNVLADFEKSFNAKGLHEFFKLFILKNEDLAELDAVRLKQVFIMREIKFLFLLPAEVDIFQNAKLKQVFDDGDLLQEGHPLKMGVAVKRGVQVTNVFNGTAFLKGALDDLPQFKYEDLDGLFDQNKFDKFINELTIGKTERVGHIMKFPCKPVRAEVRTLGKTGNYVCAFFAPEKYQDVIHFIVNGLRRYKKISTPTIISDHQLKDHLSTVDALAAAIKSTYQDKTFYKTLPLSVLFPIIVSEGHIVVCRTNLNQDKLANLKEDITDLLSTIETCVKGITSPPPFPTFFFFINHDDFDFDGSSVTILDRVKNQKISTPEDITKASFEEWTEKIKGDDEDYDNLLDHLSTTNFDAFTDQGPAAIVKLVCDALKIPAQQILRIS